MESGATISAHIRKLMAPILRESRFPSKQTLQLVQGDLTTEAVDAIVNAANSHLQHGGGVAGIIVRRGGYEIQAESDAWVREHGPVSPTEPAYTGAGRLPCRYVIHAVGPIWGEGNEDNKLAAAVTGSLTLADRLGLSSIAFPAISTGIFGFPKERAAGVIFSAIKGYFTQQPSSGLQIVRLTLFDQPTIDAFLKVWDAPTP
jgi:O-acetyl-ADP-ribose deacetylase (regulator of RNase III)